MLISKDSFRKKCIKEFKLASKKNRYYITKRINQKLLKHLKGVKNRRILFYYPLEFEADIRQSLIFLRKKCEILLPFMEGTSFKMVRFRLPLKRKKFGILEAGNSHRQIKTVDIAVVPVVGVDINLQRIGFGAGMYDRFFEKLKKKPYTIFIQPKLCFTKERICDDYDISCDILLTPQKNIKR